MEQPQRRPADLHAQQQPPPAPDGPPPPAICSKDGVVEMGTRLLFLVLFRGLCAKVWTFMLFLDFGPISTHTGYQTHHNIELLSTDTGYQTQPQILRTTCMSSDISGGRVNLKSYTLPNTP
jgi:hypothetical protein